ncbi:hypothetical protein [Stutzerimonas tarimensis]|uniref:Uncharacterized protein n=1 Tax=Stutzerimonas tarimensis TaxID=1507735 RepID=A0ABV7TAZ6_9GAMM
MNTQPLERPSRRSRSGRESKNEMCVTQKLLLGGLLLLGLALVFIGARMTLAGAASYQADAFLADWRTQTDEPNPQAWTIAQEAAQRAVNLYPVANGDYLERLGTVQAWQQFRQPYGDPAARASRLAARDSYRAAVEARPTWPYAWVHLAHSKLYLNELDDEFAQALRQAAELGPTRFDVHNRLAEIGFTAWPVLNAAQRQATLDSARFSVAYSPAVARKTLLIAEHTGMDDTLCNSLDDQLKSQRKLCQ